MLVWVGGSHQFINFVPLKLFSWSLEVRSRTGKGTTIQDFIRSVKNENRSLSLGKLGISECLSFAKTCPFKYFQTNSLPCIIVFWWLCDTRRFRLPGRAACSALVGSVQLPHTGPPVWPLFIHPCFICINASFMRAGQCPIHTVWGSVCEFGVQVCILFSRFDSECVTHKCFSARPDGTRVSTSLLCQFWVMARFRLPQTNCLGQQKNGPRFDLLQISTLTCISSSPP